MNKSKMTHDSWLVAELTSRFLEVVSGLNSRFSKLKMPMLLFICLTSVTTPAGAAIYKWVDENGVTQYSSTPPPEQQTTTLHIVPSPSSEMTQEAVRKLQQKLSESRKRDAINEQQAKNQAVQAAAIREQSLQICRFARQNLYILQMQAPVFHVDDNGERVYINDQERASRIQDLKNQVARYCE